MLLRCESHESNGGQDLDRPRSAGLLWTLNGGRLVELHRDWTIVELAENGSRRIFDRRHLGGNVWLPWIGA